ncbi:MAG: response regulator [Thermoplasmatales archaeon]|nr:MAG: response regulator [Thermoplasmatales archaeon]
MKMEKKLMVVDDDPDILIAIRYIFEKEGYEVLTVDSGIDCLKELEQGFKGIILMDIMMPFMDGWDTIREIINKNLFDGIAITIVTAKGSTEHEKMKEFERYIRNYITKPFDVGELVSTVNDIVNG